MWVNVCISHMGEDLTTSWSSDFPADSNVNSPNMVMFSTMTDIHKGKWIFSPLKIISLISDIYISFINGKALGLSKYKLAIKLENQFWFSNITWQLMHKIVWCQYFISEYTIRADCKHSFRVRCFLSEINFKTSVFVMEIYNLQFVASVSGISESLTHCPNWGLFDDSKMKILVELVEFSHEIYKEIF